MLTKVIELLNISYEDHITNEKVRRRIQADIGEYDELLTLVLDLADLHLTLCCQMLD